MSEYKVLQYNGAQRTSIAEVQEIEFRQVETIAKLKKKLKYSSISLHFGSTRIGGSCYWS